MRAVPSTAHPSPWVPHLDRLRRGLPDAAALLLVGGLALVQRLWMATHAAVHEDSFAPFLIATEILWQGTLLPQPWAPESGYGLYYTVAPAFVGADSVIDLFRNVYALGALVAPIAYVGLRWGPLAPRRDDESFGAPRAVAEARLAGLTAACWLAFSPELCDTLLNGARTYHAPFWTTVVTCGVLLALARRPFGTWLVLLCLPMAMMNHPYAAAYLLPTALLLPRLVRAAGWPGFVLALVGGVALSVPRLLDLWHSVMGPDTATHLESLARSNRATPIALWEVASSFRAAFPLSISRPGLIHGWLMLAPLLLLVPRRGVPAPGASSEKRGSLWYALFTLLGLVGFTGIALLVYHLDHYHFRVLLPALVSAGAWALVRTIRWVPRLDRVSDRAMAVSLPLVGLFAGLGYVQPGYYEPERQMLPGYPTAASTAHAITEAIDADCGDRPRRIGSINVSHVDRFFLPAVPIDMVLGGAGRDLFPRHCHTAKEAPLYIAVCVPRDVWSNVESLLASPAQGRVIVANPDPPPEPIERHRDLVLLRFDDLESASTWTSAFCDALPPERPVGFWWDLDYLPYVAEAEVHLDRSVAWWTRCARAGDSS